MLLVEPNLALRTAIAEILAADRFDVEQCDTLEEVMTSAVGHDSAVALVAWQRMDGLLAEEHRHHLSELTRRLRLVLMVPRGWARMLQSADLGVAALVAKPFNADELLQIVHQATLRSVTVESSPGCSD